MEDVAEKLNNFQKWLVLLMVTSGFAACGEAVPDNNPNMTTDRHAQIAGALSAQAQSAGSQGSASGSAKRSPQYKLASAKLSPTRGNRALGTVRFVVQEANVLVQVNLQGLAEGRHGIHIHENGDCSSTDARSAGGRFPPDGSPHGALSGSGDERLAGALGNVEAGRNGMAQLSRQFAIYSLSGGESVIGKAVIVHAGGDDFTTQAAGDAGSRVACGVIQEMQQLIALLGSQ